MSRSHSARGWSLESRDPDHAGSTRDWADSDPVTRSDHVKFQTAGKAPKVPRQQPPTVGAYTVGVLSFYRQQEKTETFAGSWLANCRTEE